MAISKENLGKLIKEARQNKGKLLNKKYTQAMLANDINKSKSYICDIELGRSYPSINTLKDIANACSLPISYFYDELQEPINSNSSNSNDIKELMSSILEQQGLMLNGEMLSEESKIALSSAIKLGLDYAEKMQAKESKKN
ncbi:helix-turn-helix domain-containing protein [Clostridium thermobutyricum]|uniref:HTH cro/C1-type domain-containing protein n=1 Tax=Clostridium thermobutyricum TaxID=29372 RepID=N9Y5C6_9CLOT|nr:helix-turn-helix transcriptional regulator [Clostridium thermobutyricum]ENZ03012.1 hypothetical protein HMPREF1092_00198 [Clostridium thermobutyricum]